MTGERGYAHPFGLAGSVFPALFSPYLAHGCKSLFAARCRRTGRRLQKVLPCLRDFSIITRWSA